jgi:hypothetical protein
VQAINEHWGGVLAVPILILDTRDRKISALRLARINSGKQPPADKEAQQVWEFLGRVYSLPLPE